MSELDQAAGKFRQNWGFDPRPAIERDFRSGDYDLAGGTAYERSFIRAMLTGARKGPLMPIPECDRAKYGGMNEVLYWKMLEGEDPDDRAIREAHGIGYTDPLEGTVCRNGCGLSYGDISAGKIRECEARDSVFDPQWLDRAASPSLPAGVIEGQDGKGAWWRYPLREFEEGDRS